MMPPHQSPQVAQNTPPPRPQVPRPFFPNLTLIVHAQSPKCRKLQEEFPNLPQLVNIVVVDASSLPRNSTGQKVPTIVNAMSDMFDKVNLARTGLKKVSAFLRDVQDKYLHATGKHATVVSRPLSTPQASFSTPLQPQHHSNNSVHAAPCGDCVGGGGASKSNDEDVDGIANSSGGGSGGGDNSGFVQKGDTIVISPERLRAINAEIQREIENAAKVPISRSPPHQPREPAVIPYNGVH